MIEDATLDYLVARRFGYLLFQRLFGTEPSDELFDAIDEDVATRAFGFVDVEGTTAAYGRELLDLAQAENRDLAARLSDYTRLFVGPAALPAPESFPAAPFAAAPFGDGSRRSISRSDSILRFSRK